MILSPTLTSISQRGRRLVNVDVAVRDGIARRDASETTQLPETSAAIARLMRGTKRPR